MLKSLVYYINTTLKVTLFKKERNLIFNDIKHYYFLSNKKFKSYTKDEKSKALDNAINWLLYSQSQMIDDGIGSYHLSKGWSSSYPETTGYIIDTLINYPKAINRQTIIKQAVKAGNWLVSVQFPSGGWQGECIDDNREEVVFNTGQVIRGLLSLYEITKEQSFYDSAMKGCDWLCSIQENSGYWKKNAFMGVIRSYDTYVDAPLLRAFKISGNELYKEKAVKNLDKVITELQTENGWFRDCDNTIKHNDKPILHTIAYTIDGIWESGKILDEEKYLLSAKLPADILLDIFLEQGFLHGRYDKTWKGSEYMINTGCAQIGIVWAKMYKHYNDKKYLQAVYKMTDLLTSIVKKDINEGYETLGAVPGSFPIWGKYESFCFPNWATKYYADLLILEQEINESNN